MPLCSRLHRVEFPCAGFASLFWPLPYWPCCLSPSAATEQRRSFPAGCSMENFNAGQLREAPHMARTPLRTRHRGPKRRRKARRMAPCRARHPLRQVRMARPRRLFSQASIRALPATGFSPLRTHQAGIASRQRERPRRLIWAASTVWWARRRTATARRIQSCSAATAFTTPRPAVTGSPLMPPSSMRGDRGKARLQNAPRRIEGLLLSALRQAVGIDRSRARSGLILRLFGRPRLARRPSLCARACPNRRAAQSPR